MIIFISGLLLVLAVLSYRHQFGPKGSRWLFVLRLLVIVLLLFVLTGQVIKLVLKERLRRVVILVDRSLSMSAATSDSLVFQKALEIKRNLNKGLNPEVWVFGESVYIAGSKTTAQFSEQTRLGKALTVIVRTKPAALLLLSDGQDNGEIDPVEAVKNLKIPVYAVGFGSELGRNLSLTDVETPVTVYAGDTINLRVRLLSSGFLKGEQVRLFAGEAVKPVVLDAGVSEQEVEFRLSFNLPGRRRVLVRAESLANELSYLDNQRTVVIDVKPARVTVVYITNRPGPETRFILNALRKNRRITVRELVATDGGLKGELGRADVFLLDEVEEKPGDAIFWQQLSQMVQAGAGLFVIAGPDFKPGSELSGLLPVKDRDVKKGTFTPRAGAGAALLDWFATDKIDLSAVPPFAGMVSGQPRDERTVVWLEAQENGLPLLLAGRVKKGRVVYLGAWPIWRWGFIPDLPLEKETPLEILLDRVIRYLSEHDTVQFRLETDASNYLSGQPVRLSFFARMPDGTPWDGLDVNINLDSGKLILPMTEKSQGKYQIDIAGVPPKEHIAVAEAKLASRVVGRANVEFVVSKQSIELIRLGLNRELLSRLANASGGWFVPAESLKEGRISQIQTKVYERKFIIDPRRLPWFFALLAVVFGLELALRRSKGLY